MLDFDESGQVSSRLGFQLANAYYHSSWSAASQFLVVLENYIQLPMNLQPLIPILTTPLPSRVATQRVVELFCDRHPGLDDKSDEVLQGALVRACQGLPQGEIELILERSLAFASTVEEMARLVLDLGMLPPELIRRFDDIFFVDLPARWGDV